MREESRFVLLSESAWCIFWQMKTASLFTLSLAKTYFVVFKCQKAANHKWQSTNYDFQTLEEEPGVRKWEYCCLKHWIISRWSQVILRLVKIFLTGRISDREVMLSRSGDCVAIDNNVIPNECEES
jgi:hypothetical protein